jgi:hypothetical protein
LSVFIAAIIEASWSILPTLETLIVETVSAAGLADM